MRSIALFVAIAGAASLTGVATGKAPSPPGVVFGGRTAQGWPIATRSAKTCVRSSAPMSARA